MWPPLRVLLILATAAGVALLAGGACATTQSQPVKFDRDIEPGVYSVTSIPVPDIPWVRFTLSLNWSATAPVDVFIMRCNDTDRFEASEPFDPFFAGAGANGKAQATVLAFNYTDPELCVVIDNTELGAVAPPTGAEFDPLHVEVAGEQTSSDDDGSIDAGPGSGSDFGAMFMFQAGVGTGLLIWQIIANGRRNRKAAAAQSAALTAEAVQKAVANAPPPQLPPGYGQPPWYGPGPGSPPPPGNR